MHYWASNTPGGTTMFGAVEAYARARVREWQYEANCRGEVRQWCRLERSAEMRHG